MAEKRIDVRGGVEWILPMKASEAIKMGEMVRWASGYIEQANSDAAGAIGIALETKTNTAVAGEKSIKVQYMCQALLPTSGVTAADNGTLAYFSDVNTAKGTGTNPIGTFVRYEGGDKAWVDFREKVLI